jgi:hypothetical protein
MSGGRKEAKSSLLWDCFTNWSLTLEKTTQQETQTKENNKE